MVLTYITDVKTTKSILQDDVLNYAFEEFQDDVLINNQVQESTAVKNNIKQRNVEDLRFEQEHIKLKKLSREIDFEIDLRDFGLVEDDIGFNPAFFKKNELVRKLRGLQKELGRKKVPYEKFTLLREDLDGGDIEDEINVDFYTRRRDMQADLEKFEDKFGYGYQLDNFTEKSYKRRSDPELDALIELHEEQAEKIRAANTLKQLKTSSVKTARPKQCKDITSGGLRYLVAVPDTAKSAAITYKNVALQPHEPIAYSSVNFFIRKFYSLFLLDFFWLRTVFKKKYQYNKNTQKQAFKDNLFDRSYYARNIDKAIVKYVNNFNYTKNMYYFALHHLVDIKQNNLLAK